MCQLYGEYDITGIRPLRTELGVIAGNPDKPNLQRAKSLLAPLSCAAKYFDDDEKEGLALLTAVLKKLSISTRAKKPNAMLAKIPRACVARGANMPSGELGIFLLAHQDWGRAHGPLCPPGHFNTP